MARLKACGQATAASGMPPIGLVVQEGLAGAMAAEDIDLVLQVDDGSTSNRTASQIGVERLVFITHPQNPIDDLVPGSLREIYSGSLISWLDVDAEEGFDQDIQPWTYQPGDEVGVGFERLVMGSVQTTPSVHRAPNPAAMLQAVQENPGAVGYVPASWLNQTVKTIVLQGEGDEEFSLPVVAFTSGEPEGLVRSLIGCLQSPPASNP
jgi:phosphate transport system substrate-binding protein